MLDTQTPLFNEQVRAEAEEQIVEHTKRIDYYITEYSIELLAKKMREGDFEVPSYQREYTWEPERKWRFIESVMMNLPIPFLFFWENPETGILEIVDGSQRLRTIEEFLHGDLELGELERLTLLTGFGFKDLSESRQRKIRNRSIRGIVLNEHADKQARLDLFERINTGSKIANDAEIRRGALTGPFIELVIRLAIDPLFTNLTPVSEKRMKEREREELVTRFFAYGDGLQDYSDEVHAFLFTYSKRMNGEFIRNSTLVAEYETRFNKTMQFISGVFPYGFRRSAKGNASTRARFESIAIGTYEALKVNPELVGDPSQVKIWIESPEFAEVTGSDGANAVAKLKKRIGFVRDHLLGVAQ